jgi:hypothetical protein
MLRKTRRLCDPAPNHNRSTSGGPGIDYARSHATLTPAKTEASAHTYWFKYMPGSDNQTVSTAPL